jgi:hypothetical protein
MKDRNNERAAQSDKESHAVAKGAAAGAVTGAVAGGAITGALAGGLTGPAGVAIGAAAGAVAGALAGKAAKEQQGAASNDKWGDGSHLSMEGDAQDANDSYWRNQWSSRPYVQDGATYDDYGPAYRHGEDAHTRYPGRHFDEIEPDLGRDWQTARGNSSLEWEHARHASRDAWERLKDGAERLMPGDADGDSR